MIYADLNDFIARGAATLPKEPVAVIFVEDDAEVASTLRHTIGCGFAATLVLMPPDFALAEDVAPLVQRIGSDLQSPTRVPDAMNRLIDRLAGVWMFYGYNAEYLFYPFSESRSVGEMLTFHTEERRDAMLTYVVDLYAGDLGLHPNGVALEDAWLDRSGYYALARPDPATGHPRDRQLDFFGGLRWRFEEHIPPARRKIDRISLFRAKQGLRLRPDHTFNDEEYNTYACPWHHNLTAALCSFRTAKALKRNPGSTFDIHTFRWHNSIPFQWHSRQLMDLGLMEPGQWF